MDKNFVKLASENFYATPETIRSFFMVGTEKLFNDTDFQPAPIVEGYGEEYNNIYITGVMLRERSILTDLGYATSTEQVIEEIKNTLSQGKKARLIINSGGGLVSGTSNLADIIYENRENIEAYATGMVASAAMWVFSSAGKRYAEKTTVMGSIGVVTSVLDDEEYWKSYGIIWKEVVSENAKNKRPDVKTESGMNEVKRYLTSLETVFIDTVAKNLDMSRDDVINKFHQGGLITGQEAYDMGVINGIISYDLATMPTATTNSDKIAKSNLGDYTMEFSAEQFDAVKSQLDEALASKQTLENDLAGLRKENETLNASIKGLEDKLNATVEKGETVIAMAFEHGVNKDTALAMFKAEDAGKAAMIALGAKSTTQATVQASDIGEEVEDEQGEDEELAYAMQIAKKLSVK